MPLAGPSGLPHLSHPGHAHPAWVHAPFHSLSGFCHRYSLPPHPPLGLHFLLCQMGTLLLRSLPAFLALCVTGRLRPRHSQCLCVPQPEGVSPITGQGRRTGCEYPDSSHVQARGTVALQRGQGSLGLVFWSFSMWRLDSFRSLTSFLPPPFSHFCLWAPPSLSGNLDYAGPCLPRW